MLKSFLDRVKKSRKNKTFYVSDLDSYLKTGDPAAAFGNTASPMFDLNPYLTDRYEFRETRKAFFAVSSGLCNLSCPYCITGRPRSREHLKKEDFAFIFDYFGENIYFGFSGLGDFFCGYSKNEQLLRYLLGHDVMVFLDINGVEIHELGDSDLEHKERVGKINVSFHYGTMKRQKLLRRWVDSVRKIQDNRYNYDLKMVSSPLEKEICEEAINFYRDEVHPITGQKLILAPDGLVDLASQLDELTRIAGVHGDMIDFSGREAIYRERVLDLSKSLPCPAGSRYFRIFQNGDIVPCEFFRKGRNFTLGNSRERKMVTFKGDLSCNYTGFCDCFAATNPQTGMLDETGAPYRHRSS